MAPKKSVEKTSSPAKNKQAKVPKVRAKKEKPKLKIPSIVKVKLPSIKSFLAANQHEAEMTPTKALTAAQRKINLANERKVELANEVALAQLVRSPVPKTTEVSPPPKVKQVKATAQKTTKVPVRKKARPKKVKGLENSTTEEVEVTPKRKASKKSKTKSVKKEVETVNKTDAPSPRKPVLKRNKVPATPSKYSASPKTRFNLRKGKKISEDLPTNEDPHSPSVLDLEAKNHLNNKENGNHESSKENASNEKSELVNSRKTSTNSECPSWTKDISSSSTTTCVTVCSTDFVRIDNKIPMIKLSNINNELKKTVTVTIKDDQLLSDSDTNEKSTKCTSESSWSSDANSASGPNLSSPSNSTKSHNTSVNNFNASLSSEKRNNISKMDYVLDKLSSKLKQLDLEIINWIGYGNEDVPKPTIEFQDKIFKILKEECEVITNCRNLKAIFANDSENKNNEDSPNIDSNNDFTKQTNDYNAANLTDISEDDHYFTSSASKYAMLDQRSNNDSLQEKPSAEMSEEDFTSNKVKHTAFDQSYDDDDALSLFAESITGLESSRYSSAASMCVGTDFEEYIPQPVSKDQFTESISYHPTKITNNDIGVTNKTKTVCKKQFADSTYTESELNEEPSGNASTTVNERSYDTLNSDQTAECNPPIHTLNSQKQVPCLMSSLHKATSAVKSVVFRGVCFFNLISNCKKARCTFPHIQLDLIEVKNRLVRLSEGLFIQEYMLMRNWPGLRRQYGMCFVEECINRDLTRILIEIAIDFIQKANVNSFEDSILKVDVNEHVLMHLNKIDLNTCADLLQYNVEQNKTLCDVFMQTIAETQNFSRFKLVFIKLTHFNVQNGGSFSLDVANQILERVCILPCEMPLAKALMTIMENTDQTIFQNTMTKQFEKHLSSLDSDIYEKYMSMKQQALINMPGLDNINQEQDKTSVAQSDGDRYTSPDTTKLDNLNKPIEEPIVTRNLDMLRNLSFNNMQQNTSRQEDYRPSPKKQKFNQYGSITHFMNRFQLRPPRPPMRPHGPIMRPPMNQRRLDQRHVVYGQFPNFPRRPGHAPDF